MGLTTRSRSEDEKGEQKGDEKVVERKAGEEEEGDLKRCD